MNCDICNSTVFGGQAILLSTRDVVTSKDCWKLYLKSLIADGALRGEDVPNALAGFVGQMASSDTPWALCQRCVVALGEAGFAFPSASRTLAPRGHALCHIVGPVQYEIMDDEGMRIALEAAFSAARDLLPGAVMAPPLVVAKGAATQAGGSSGSASDQ
jgi:hypothetical protein